MMPKVLVASEYLNDYSEGGAKIHLSELAKECGFDSFILTKDRMRSALSLMSSIRGHDVLWLRGYKIPLLAMLLGKLSGKKIVYDCSSIESVERGKKSSELLERFFFRAADRIRVLNEEMKDYLVIERKIAPGKVFVVPVGSEEKRAHWKMSREMSGQKKFLYLGSAEEWQGINLILEAFRDIKEKGLKLVVVGASEDEVSAGFRVMKNVEFSGRVSHGETEDFYLDSYCVVIPRPKTRITSMVLPMKLVEAMSYGMPIIASDLSAISSASQSDHKRGALLCEPDAKSLRCAVLSVASDEEMARTLSANALDIFGRKFSWKILSQEISKEINNLCGP